MPQGGNAPTPSMRDTDARGGGPSDVDRVTVHRLEPPARNPKTALFGAEAGAERPSEPGTPPGGLSAAHADTASPCQSN